MTALRRLERLCVGLAAVVALLVLVEMSKPVYVCNNPHRDAERDMFTLWRSIQLYRLHHEKVPESLDDLVEGGIIQRLVPDPWGTQYELHVEDDRWAIRCAGPDGEFGTLDDSYEFGPV